MTDLERIYQDEKNWMFFEGETQDETIGVYLKCTHCGRYVKKGELLMNGAGEVRLKRFICKKCGEIQPYYDRDI